MARNGQRTPPEKENEEDPEGQLGIMVDSQLYKIGGTGGVSQSLHTLLCARAQNTTAAAADAAANFCEKFLPSYCPHLTFHTGLDTLKRKLKDLLFLQNSFEYLPQRNPAAAGTIPQFKEPLRAVMSILLHAPAFVKIFRDEDKLCGGHPITAGLPEDFLS